MIWVRPNLYRMRLAFIADDNVVDKQQNGLWHSDDTNGAVAGRAQSDQITIGHLSSTAGPCSLRAQAGAQWTPPWIFPRNDTNVWCVWRRCSTSRCFAPGVSGMPETDEFYNLCDRYGIMVMQEWPTAWNSHREGWQPYPLLEETVRRNTLRLRNHASLVMWGAGNESDRPFGKAIDMMGRYAVELDGSRPFHRAEPWGGSVHNYDCDWGAATAGQCPSFDRAVFW